MIAIMKSLEGVMMPEANTSRSQSRPVYPMAQIQSYLLGRSLSIQVPPLRHGFSKHSLMFTQTPDERVDPSGHLNSALQRLPLRY